MKCSLSHSSVLLSVLIFNDLAVQGVSWTDNRIRIATYLNKLPHLLHSYFKYIPDIR